MEIRLDKEIFVKFEIKQLDKIMRLDNETYLDIKYLSLCSFIDRIARYISPDIKNSFVRFENIATNYYNKGDFKLIDMRYFNQGQFLIGDHQNNDYLKQNAKKYYDKLIKDNLYNQLRPIFDKEFNLELIGNDSEMRYQTIDNLLKILKYEQKNIDSVDDYLKLFNNAHILYQILRCPLVHEQKGHFLIGSEYSLDDSMSIRLSPLSMMTPDLIDTALKEILDKWKSE